MQELSGIVAIAGSAFLAAGLVKGVVGLEIKVERLEAKFKLSQNRNPADFANIIALAEKYMGDWPRVDAPRIQPNPLYKPQRLTLADPKLNRAYTMGNKNNTDYVYCLDATTGTKLFQARLQRSGGNEREQRGPGRFGGFGGPGGSDYSSPVAAGETIYYVSSNGDVHVFIEDVTTSADAEAITMAIIALAKAMDLEVVAEGVEKQEQVDFLRKRGCQKAQGYLLGRPARPADFLASLETRRLGSRASA